MEPPSYPWAKGHSEPFYNFVIEVEVCCTKSGDLWSNHKLQGDVDTETAMELPTGGMEQASHALLMEAMKKEALLQMLVKMSNDPDFRKRTEDTAEEAQGKLVAEIHDAMMKFGLEVFQKYGCQAAQLALNTVQHKTS